VEILELIGRQLPARPFNDGCSMRVEIVKVTLRGYIVIVIALDHGTAERTDYFKAFMGTCIITYDISRTEIFLDPLLAGIFKNDLERVDIGMDIT
jgi:hypothetical protein